MIKFQQRFGDNVLEFGDAVFTVRGITGREREYFVASTGDQDQLLLQLGVRGWRGAVVDGADVPHRFEPEMDYLGGTLKLTSASALASLPQACLDGLFQAVRVLSRLQPAEREQLGFTLPRTETSAPAAATESAAPPAPAG